MEIYQLRAFIAVARTGNMTRAAEHLHVTQSAVSKQLKALEEEFGAPLFERSAAGMTLSAAGKRLMPLAKRTLEATTELMSAAKLDPGPNLRNSQAGHDHRPRVDTTGRTVALV